MFYSSIFILFLTHAPSPAQHLVYHKFSGWTVLNEIGFYQINPLVPVYFFVTTAAARKRYPEATNMELNQLTGYALTRACDKGGQKKEREAKKQREGEAGGHN
jgi:hypothetical protein